VLACAGGLYACAGAPTLAARQGDLAGLKSAVLQAEREGQLGPGAVKELAGAVLERELVSLREPLGDLPELQPCVRDVRGVLEELAHGSGEPAAWASLELLDAGFDAPEPAAAPSSAPALIVEARRAEGERAGSRRRALLLHGDAAVRRAAIEAAAHSRLQADVSALLEVARLDPDPSSRELALGALGALGGARVVLGLRDLWAGAAAEQRLAIVAAWSLPATFAAGGERELVRTAELGSGTAAVAAALELSAQAAGPDGLAQGVLARALRGADRSARLLALYEVPWADAELRALIVEAQSSPDDATRLLSLWRQVEQGPLPAAQLEALRALAAAEDTVVGLLARATLARAGDSSANAGLLGDLGAPRARDRILAALALVTLQKWASAAHALGDDSPLVRQTVACQMLAEAPRGASETELGRAQSFGPFASKLTTLLE